METACPIESALTFIEAHLDQPLQLDDIAQHVHLSRFHFLRLFRKTLHETPHQYLTRRRLEKAKELLANSELSVTEICFAIGFESLGSFSSLFYKIVGWPPTVYRARTLEQRRNPYKFIPHCYCTMYGLKSDTDVGSHN